MTILCVNFYMPSQSSDERLAFVFWDVQIFLVWEDSSDDWGITIMFLYIHLVGLFKFEQYGN